MRVKTCVLLLASIGACLAPALPEAREAAREIVQAKMSAEAKAYMDYRKEVPKAKRLEDLYFHFDAKTIDYYKSLNAAERTKITEQLKAQVTLFPELTVAKEERGLGVATVLFNAKAADGKEALLVVEVVREGAALKIGPSTWKMPQ